MVSCSRAGAARSYSTASTPEFEWAAISSPMVGRPSGRGLPSHRRDRMTDFDMTDFDFSRFDVMTFDCYGTLIDWETGIERGLRAFLDPWGVTPDGEELLETFARSEAVAEAGPYLRYRDVLAICGSFSASSSWCRSKCISTAANSPCVAVCSTALARWPASSLGDKRRIASAARC